MLSIFTQYSYIVLEPSNSTNSTKTLKHLEITVCVYYMCVCVCVHSLLGLEFGALGMVGKQRITSRRPGLQNSYLHKFL